MQFSNMITAVDTHACEPMRVITGGVVDVPGTTMLEKMKWLETEGDELRRRMLREPRGYPPLCCNLILPPTCPEADAGFVVMEQTEYPAMSGGNTIAVATVLLETGMVSMREPVTELVLESPAGLIPVRANCAHGKVTQVTFQNVPAFATHLDIELDVPHLGKVMVDIAWGGMFYVINEDFRHEGILGTIFTGQLVEETQVGPYTAVVPTVGGQAWITGFANYVLDPTDPFPNGFTVGDIWP
jgi:proline racemase